MPKFLSVGYGLRLFSAIFATVDDFIFLSGYLLVFYSSKFSTLLKKLTLFRRRKTVPLKDGTVTEYGTFGESNHKTVLSYTYCEDVPYTGEFTTAQSE